MCVNKTTVAHIFLSTMFYFVTQAVGPFYDAYFSPDDNIAQKFIECVEHEQKSIDIAIYTLTHGDVIKALINAHQRNIAVTIIIDEFSLIANKTHRRRMEQIISAGIPLYLFNPKKFYYAGSGHAQLFFNQHKFLSGYQEHQSTFDHVQTLSDEQVRQLSIRPVMHHKFCIFGKNKDEKSLLWTGSFNLTFFGNTRNQENVVLTDDTDTIRLFQEQFDLIKRERTNLLTKYTNGTTGTTEVYFAPDQDMFQRIISLIDSEKKSIKMAIYSLSHRDIIDALIRAYQKGIDVQIILDHGKKAILAHAGISVYLFVPEKFGNGKRMVADQEENNRGHHGKTYALMHNKFCLFGCNEHDKRLIWTGSTNFAYFSNLIFQNNAVVLDNPALIDKFEKQFELIKNKRARAYRYNGLVGNKNYLTASLN